MEIAAIVAGVIALRRYPFPFIVVIIAVALWFMSMDLAPWIAGKRRHPTWETRRMVSLWFGLAVLVVAWIVDCRERGGDFAFWLHLFGMMAFWGAREPRRNSGSAVRQGALLRCINVGLLFIVGLSRAARLCGVRRARHRRSISATSPTRCSRTRCCSRSRCR